MSASPDPSKVPVRLPEKDEPFADTVAYGNGPQDSVTGVSEAAAVTHHRIALGGKEIACTARAGHLVTVDPSSSKPEAAIFYVAFTAEQPAGENRPVTFFYNGGPGSSSVYVLLGSTAAGTKIGPESYGLSLKGQTASFLNQDKPPDHYMK
jgi:carboxypeptidase C (cathepsin A)